MVSCRQRPGDASPTGSPNWSPSCRRGSGRWARRWAGDVRREPGRAGRPRRRPAAARRAGRGRSCSPTGPACRRVHAICLDERGAAAAGGVHRGRGGRPRTTADAAPHRQRRPRPASAPTSSTADWCERLARALAPLRDVSPEHDAGAARDRCGCWTCWTWSRPTAAAIAARLGGGRPQHRRRARRAATTAPFAVDLVRDGPHGAGRGHHRLRQVGAAADAGGVARRGEPAGRADLRPGRLQGRQRLQGVRASCRTPSAWSPTWTPTWSSGRWTRSAPSCAAASRCWPRPAPRTSRTTGTSGAADPALAPLPRLLLVIDEFASLVRELPDFVAGLVDIAQRGRSLGIHLVLATQRPAGRGHRRHPRQHQPADRAARHRRRREPGHHRRPRGRQRSPRHPGTGADVRRAPPRCCRSRPAWVGGRPAPGAAPQAGRGRARCAAAELSWQRLGRPVDCAAPTRPARRRRARADGPAGVRRRGRRGGRRGLAGPRRAAQPVAAGAAGPGAAGRADRANGTARRTSVPPLIPYALEDVPQLQQRRVADRRPRHVRPPVRDRRAALGPHPGAAHHRRRAAAQRTPGRATCTSTASTPPAAASRRWRHCRTAARSCPGTTWNASNGSCAGSAAS